MLALNLKDQTSCCAISITSGPETMQGVPVGKIKKM